MRTVRLLVLIAALASVSGGLLAQTASTRQAVRAPAVAGQYYPAEASALKQALEAFLRDALVPRPDRPIAMVVPHAGYMFSAQIAADAFRQAGAHRYDTVVLLGTNHTAPIRGRVSIYPGSGFRTPLGVAEVDRPLADALAGDDSTFVLESSAHASEHSIEVQVPFVQHLFPAAKILPAVVAADDPALCVRAGRALAKALQGRQVLIVASSDLSHYPTAREAAGVDRRTLEAIASLSPERLRATIVEQMQRGIADLATTACGEAPITVAMAAATALGATRGTVVSYANSADVAVGDPDRAVGYGAVVFTDGPKGADTSALALPVAAARDAPVGAEDKKALLRLARETLRRYLTTDTLPLARGFETAGQRSQGVFVTLKKRGELRGCIGQFEGNGTPLPKLVSVMTLQSALNDPRFPKVTAREIDSLEFEISVLTTPRPIGRFTEIVLGRDGVIMRKNGRSAVFLPQVATEEGWDREEMLDNLSLKAGLPAGAWRSGASFLVFQADVFHEGQFK